KLNRPNLIVWGHIILHPRWEEACLMPVHTGLEPVIRHKTNRTLIAGGRLEFLPSLCALPIPGLYGAPKYRSRIRRYTAVSAMRSAVATLSSILCMVALTRPNSTTGQ